jgi:hypothetical protein
MAACKDLGTCSVSVDGRVATITITPPARLEGGTSDLHWDLGEIFSELRDASLLPGRSADTQQALGTISKDWCVSPVGRRSQIR